MEYFRFGYPASFALISSWLMVLSSRYVIGLVQNSREVGLYSVSSQLSDRPLRLLLTGIMLAAYPIIVEIWESKGRESTEELINKLSRYYIILITPFLILLCIFAKEIVLLVSTREYVDGARAIPFIAVGIFFFGLMQYVSKGFELKKLTSQMAAIMWSAGILNLVLTFILVSKFGFVGAAISMMISYIFLFSCFLHRIGPHLTWTIPFKSLYRILVAALILVSFLLVTKSFMTEAVLMLIIASFSGLLIYGGILILTGEISRREVQALVGLFRTPKADNQVG